MATKKDKLRFSGIRRGMRILGSFHYLSGAFRLILSLLMPLAGFPALGDQFKADTPPSLSFTASWDSTLLGVLLFLFLIVSSVTEFIVGRNWRRKAMNTRQQTVTMILTGIKALRAVYIILAGGFLSVKTADIFSLVLNTVSFSLAFLMHREYLRTKQVQPE